MTTGDFRKLMNDQPFKPFALVMSSGERVEVRHPENAMMTRTSIHISELTPTGRLSDDYHQYSLLHVTKIEYLADSPSAPAEAA
jgi:hypothetical protein